MSTRTTVRRRSGGTGGTTPAASATPRSSASYPTSPRAAVALLTWRRVHRGALVVLLVTAGMSAFVASTHQRVFAEPGAVAGLEAIAANPAIRLLFGEPLALDDAGGFAVWRVGTVTAVLLGTWTILATTGLTRGEEQAGRSAVLLAGPMSARTLLARQLAVLALAPVVTGAALAGALWLVGTAPAGALVHGAGTALLGVFFLALAASSAQVCASRSAASGAAVGVLGAALLARMIGDGYGQLAWLRWTSPFGLLELSGPYQHDRLSPLLVLLAATLTLAAAALLAVGRRDVGGGLLARRPQRRQPLHLLSSVPAFALRHSLRPVAAWSAGIGAYYLLIGLVAVSVTDFLAGGTGLAGMADQAGFAHVERIEGFAATLFTLLAVPVGAFAAARIGAFAAAEGERLLTPLAAAPLSRVRLLSAEVAATLAGALVLSTVAAVATWAGVGLAGGDLALSAALAGTFNTLPVVLLCVGAAVLAFGWAAPAVTAIGCLPAAGGFLLRVLADSFDAPDWLSDLSPFSHLASAPVQSVNWPASLVMTGIALVLAAVGAAAYRRRDLRA